ncbi:unnamed protein product, partial [Larinioides sclopetarius]
MFVPVPLYKSWRSVWWYRTSEKSYIMKFWIVLFFTLLALTSAYKMGGGGGYRGGGG